MTPSIDQTLHLFANLIPSWTLIPILTLFPNFWGFQRTLQRVRLANRGRLLLRTPGPVPFGTCICSNVETILSWNLSCLRTFWVSNIPRYFYFAFRMSLYIFLLYNIYYLYLTGIDFYVLCAWGGCWFVVYISSFIYNFLNVFPFDYTTVAWSGTVVSVNQVNHTSWVALDTSTDRPKSVRNRCVIELFMALFVLSLCPFDISVGVGAFVIGLSQISFA